jgi:DNA/RNA endonuclease G (NUC1)
MTFSRRLVCCVLVVLQFAAAARATIGTTLQSQLGNPSSATTVATATTNYLIARPQYALSYNNSTREPNWVSWNLTTADVGTSGRSANFFQDTSLPAGFYQVLTTDYSGSGYDRGHMCPSGDRTITEADNEATFFMTNMIPQSPDNNQGVWANFESECRSIAAAGNEVLIISGPSGYAGASIASGVAIAGYTWKIAVVVPVGSGTAVSRITSATRVIAIKIPNIAGVRSTPWQNYITTAGQIETDTGYTFFTELPASVATALRAKIEGAAPVGSPTITTQPAAQTAAVGGSATFSVTATGDATLTYQWSRDDVVLPSAQSATLTLSSLTAADAGNYSVVVKNALGSATSVAVSLTITGLPPAIVTSPSARTVSAGSTATFAVVASGSPTLTYQWRKAGVALTGNTSATTAALTLTNAQATDATNYDVVITNSVGSVTSVAAALTVTPAAPSVTSVPTTQTSAPGATATLTVVASGTAPLTYQWRKAGVALTGNTSATTATLSIPGATTADSGSYDVVITNALGSTTSAAITLNITVIPPDPVRWDFTTATPTNGLPADVSGGTVVQRNNFGTTQTLTTVSVSSGYTGVSGTSNAGAAARVGALNLAEGGSAFFEFTLTPAAARQFSVTGLSFGARSTATGPQAYALFVVNGTAEPALIASGPLANNSAWTRITPTFLPIVSDTATSVTFRLYGCNGTGNAGVNTANWRIDDLAVQLTTGTGLTAGATKDRRLTNLSSRVRTANAPDVAIAGFTIAGTASKLVLIRAAGPTLGLFGVTGSLSAPKLDLFRGSSVIETNTGWTTAANSAAIAAAASSSGAFDFAAGSADSAILTTLAPGGYTAQISSGSGSAGVGLIEVYDLSTATVGQNLVNLSTRALAGTGNEMLISGLIIGGTLPKRVLIRAAGPALAAFNLTGVLARPQLTLFSGNTPVFVNSGWSTSADAAAITTASAQAGAFAFASGSADAAMIVTLAPGAYTAQVTGVGGTTGLALVEIYELP